jgi:hypothetical protein
LGDNGWAALGAVGNQIVIQGSFDCRNYGFSKLSEDEAGVSLWELDLTRSPVVRPPWFRLSA